MVSPQLNSRKRGLLIQGWHYPSSNKFHGMMISRVTKKGSASGTISRLFCAQMCLLSHWDGGLQPGFWGLIQVRKMEGLEIFFSKTWWKPRISHQLIRLVAGSWSFWILLWCRVRFCCVYWFILGQVKFNWHFWLTIFIAITISIDYDDARIHQHHHHHLLLLFRQVLIQLWTVTVFAPV